MSAFLKMVLAKLTSGDVTFVEAVRWVHEWSGKVLALIDGTPLPFGEFEMEDDPAECSAAYAALYEHVNGEQPAMATEAGAEAAAIDPMAIFLLITQILELLRKRRQQ